MIIGRTHIYRNTCIYTYAYHHMLLTTHAGRVMASCRIEHLTPGLSHEAAWLEDRLPGANAEAQWKPECIDTHG